MEGRGRGETAKREKELKDRAGSGEMQRKNRTEIRNAEMANTVQVSVHKEANSSCGEKHRWHINSLLEVESQRRKLEERQVSFFSPHRARMQKRGSEGGVRPGKGVTNLECENLITVESGMCAVARRPLRRGSDRLKR